MGIELSSNELRAIREIALEKTSRKALAQALKKSKAQTYKITNNLIKKGLLEKRGINLAFQKHSFISLLIKVIITYPNIISTLANSGIVIFSNILEPKTLEDIKKETGLKKSVIYRKLQSAWRISLIRKDNGKYFFNKQVWPELNEALEDYKRYFMRTLPELDSDILIRGKYGNVTVAEAYREIPNATPTAISEYYKYGVKILSSVIYYHFPKEKLNIKQVFIDSLIVIEDNDDYRNKLYACLFYLKNKAKLKGIKHWLIDNLNRVLIGEEIKGFPILSEIKEKAKLYDIKI